MAKFGRVGGVAALVVSTMLATAAGAAAQAPTDYGSVIATLDREIPAAMAQAKVVGLTIALVDGNRTVLTKGYGSADQAAGKPVAADTLFHIGSASKTLTAAAVMQLVEQRRVDLDAPLARYVPEFSMLPRFPGSVITVRSVLDMHSGIPGDIMNGAATTERPYRGWRSWMLKQLARETPERPANTAWSYSNSGYALLQNLVENVTGQSFDTYTREQLFGPMGMGSTTFDDAALADGSWAKPYGLDTRTGTVRERPREFMNGWAAGSVMSSADDMAAYLKTMIGRGATPDGGRILQASTVAQMLVPQTDLPLDVVNTRQGLGWYIGDDMNAWMGNAASWDGDTINYHAYLRWLPDADLGVFVAVNTDVGAGLRDALGTEALGLMVTAKTGRTAPAATPPSTRVVRVPEAELRRAAGRYASGVGIDLLRATPRGLRWTPGAQRPGLETMLMLPRADGWYTASKASANLPAAAVSIKPTVLAGRRVLLWREPYGGATPLISLAGERLPDSYRVPRAWRERAGIYHATGVLPRTYPGLVVETTRLRVFAGVLLREKLEGTQWAARVLRPTGDRRAVTIGYTSFQVARGAGSVVRAVPGGFGELGVTYRRAR